MTIISIWPQRLSKSGSWLIQTSQPFRCLLCLALCFLPLTLGVSLPSQAFILPPKNKLLQIICYWEFYKKNTYNCRLIIISAWNTWCATQLSWFFMVFTHKILNSHEWNFTSIEKTERRILLLFNFLAFLSVLDRPAWLGHFRWCSLKYNLRG